MKKKIIHLISDLRVGGVQKVVLDICSSADLDKYDVLIYSLGESAQMTLAYDLDPAVIIKTFSYEFDDDYSILSYIKHNYFSFLYSKKANTILEEAVKDKPDILHVHLPLRELYLGLLIQKKINCQLLFTQHLLFFGRKSLGIRLLRLVLRKTLKKYHLTTVNEELKNEIIENRLLGKFKELFLIENKLNLNLYRKKKKKPKDFISVVYVARIGYPKAHDDLIKAWSKLNHLTEKKKLFLVGPDSMDNQMQLLADKLNVSDSVVFMGVQYGIADILNECDFAVFPSHREGLPIALLEKMAMELSVIVSDIPELTKIIKNNFNGLIFQCGNIVDLSEKIGILLKDAELRNKLGKEARKTVENRYGSFNIASAYESVYEKIT